MLLTSETFSLSPARLLVIAPLAVLLTASGPEVLVTTQGQDQLFVYILPPPQAQVDAMVEIITPTDFGEALAVIFALVPPVLGVGGKLRREQLSGDSR